MPRPRLADLVCALAVLTPLTAGTRRDVHSPGFARATLFFPLVGALIGGLVLGLYLVLGNNLPGFAVALLIGAAWTGLSWPTLAVGEPGLPLRLALLAAKVLLLSFLSHAVASCLFFAPVLGRWAIVVLAIGARDANDPGRKLNAAIAFRDFGWTSTFAGVVLAWAGEALGIAIFVLIAALVLVVRVLAHRFAGGVSWASLCTTVQLIELTCVALCAAL